MPARPKLAAAAASETRFPTWDELVAEAQVTEPDGKPKPPYEIPLPKGKPILIEVFDGDTYLDIVAAQRRGDAAGILEAMIPNPVERNRLREAMRGVHYPIIDVLAGKVLRYFYGLSIENEEKSGNSPAS